jgi:hypothetical protein
LNQDGARAAASAADIALEGLTGTRDGIIGALAGVGLFADGNDGRYLWKRRLRELFGEIIAVDELLAATGIDDIRLFEGGSIAAEASARIDLGEWARPVRIDGLAVLLVQKQQLQGSADYECIEKSRIKAFRP